MTSLGGDIYKAEFPVNVKETGDEVIWRDACAELTVASKVPWVLLSAGVDFETFMRQTLVACQSGASGVLADRALWSEAAINDENQRRQFLNKSASTRMKQLREICQSHARPWTEHFDGPLTDQDWFRTYSDL